MKLASTHDMLQTAMPKTTTHIVGSELPGPSSLPRITFPATAKAAEHTDFTVPNQAMLPTLRIHAVVPLDLGAYEQAPIARGDVVVFRSEKHDGLLLASRAVGLPGETIELRRARLMIDGVEVEESYLETDVSRKSYSREYGPIAIPPNCVFLLGDFRDLSEDSRTIGPVVAGQIVGRLVL